MSINNVSSDQRASSMSDSSDATSSPFPADAELITSLAHTNASSTPPVTPLSSSLGLLWIDGGFKEQEGTGVAVIIAHTKTEKLPKKTRRRDRNRPHHEIARLKTQINEMSRKRQKLLATANESSRRFLRARAENEELKKTLRRHVDHTASLTGVLLSQTSKTIEVPRSLLVTGRNLMYNAKEDAAVYQMLARNVDEHYGCTNRVLQAAGLLGVTAEIRDSQMRRPPHLDSEKEYVLQSRMSGLLPFEEELINDTVWRVLTSESMLVGDQNVAKTLGLSLGVAAQIVIVKQEVVLHSDGEPSATSCTIRSVLKRFVEKDRVVNVWDAIGDWPCTGAACQVSTRERGWSIVQSMNGEEAAGISVAQNFVLVTPTATAIGADDSTVIECVIRLYQRVIESRDQVMENSFMDESIQRKRITNSKSQST